MVNSDLLKGLTPEEAHGVLALGKPMHLSSGQGLFQLGDAASAIYLVIRGRLRLMLPIDVRGQRQTVVVEERSTGQAVGWSALTPPHQFTLTATAALDTDLVALDREALTGYLEAHPRIGYLVASNLASMIGHRLQLLQAMWLREIQRMVESRCA
jgi:CRP-like cAMP-binding protein